MGRLRALLWRRRYRRLVSEVHERAWAARRARNRYYDAVRKLGAHVLRDVDLDDRETIRALLAEYRDPVVAETSEIV